MLPTPSYSPNEPSKEVGSLCYLRTPIVVSYLFHASLTVQINSTLNEIRHSYRPLDEVEEGNLFIKMTHVLWDFSPKTYNWFVWNIFFVL